MKTGNLILIVFLVLVILVSGCETIGKAGTSLTLQSAVTWDPRTCASKACNPSTDKQCRLCTKTTIITGGSKNGGCIADVEKTEEITDVCSALNTWIPQKIVSKEKDNNCRIDGDIEPKYLECIASISPCNPKGGPNGNKCVPNPKPDGTDCVTCLIKPCVCKSGVCTPKEVDCEKSTTKTTCTDSRCNWGGTENDGRCCNTPEVC